MTRYADLIAKLESCEGPDRHLDSLIWAEVDERDILMHMDGRLMARSRQAPHDTCLLDPEKHKPPLPKFTESLDAALPWERIKMVVSTGEPEEWTAWHQWELAGDLTSSGLCKTEAIARRLAALKARAVEEGEE